MIGGDGKFVEGSDRDWCNANMFKGAFFDVDSFFHRWMWEDSRCGNIA